MDLRGHHMNVGHYDKYQARAYDLKPYLIQLWRHTTDVDSVIKEIAGAIRAAVDKEVQFKRIDERGINAIDQVEPDKKTDH